MQKQVDVDFQPARFACRSGPTTATTTSTSSSRDETGGEKLQELGIVVLRLQEVVEGHLGAGAGDADGAVAALEGEDADLVGGDGEVEFVPGALRVAGPGDEDAAVGQVLGGVFEGAELGHAAAGAGQFALVVPLLGEGHQEAFFALFVLQRDHGLLDVVVVRFQLAFEVCGLVVEAAECEFDGFEFFLSLDSSAVFGADVDCDGVEEVLVVVVPGETAVLFEAEDVFEGGAFQFCVGHGGDVDQGVGFGVCRVFMRGGGEFVADERIPAIFIFHGDWFDHDLHQIAARFNADYVQDAAFGLGEQSLNFGVGI